MNDSRGIMIASQHELSSSVQRLQFYMLHSWPEGSNCSVYTSRFRFSLHFRSIQVFWNRIRYIPTIAGPFDANGESLDVATCYGAAFIMLPSSYAYPATFILIELGTLFKFLCRPTWGFGKTFSPPRHNVWVKKKWLSRPFFQCTSQDVLSYNFVHDLLGSILQYTFTIFW